MMIIVETFAYSSERKKHKKFTSNHFCIIVGAQLSTNFIFDSEKILHTKRSKSNEGVIWRRNRAVDLQK